MAGSRTLRAFSRLLSYPDEGALEACELLYIVLKTEIPEAAAEIARFGEFLERTPSAEHEEAYAATFDLNPGCALEIGWHLFGEEYDRGLLLVRLREELRKHGLSESSELPDHLTHVLPLIAEMSEDEAARFVTACVLPAVEKFAGAVARSGSPYRPVAEALACVLRTTWGENRPLADGSPRRRSDGREIPDDVDLLHAFPAANVSFDRCAGGCGSHESHPPLVQLAAVPFRETP